VCSESLSDCDTSDEDDLADDLTAMLNAEVQQRVLDRDAVKRMASMYQQGPGSSGGHTQPPSQRTR
jgi:hypothetical protein